MNNLLKYQIPLIFIAEDCNPKGVSRSKPPQLSDPLHHSHRGQAQCGYWKQFWGSCSQKAKRKMLMT